MHELSLPADLVARVTERAGRAHPFDVIEPAKCAFVVVDMQNYFMKPGFQGEVPKARAIVPAVNRRWNAVKRAGSRRGWRLPAERRSRYGSRRREDADGGRTDHARSHSARRGSHRTQTRDRGRRGGAPGHRPRRTRARVHPGDQQLGLIAGASTRCVYGACSLAGRVCRRESTADAGPKAASGPCGTSRPGSGRAPWPGGPWRARPPGPPRCRRR